MCCFSVKTLLNVINFIFALTGAVVLGVGSYATVKFSEYADVIGDVKLPIAMIVFGAFILLTAVLGFIGVRKASNSDQKVIRQGRCVLIMYAVLMFLIFVMQLAVGASIAVFIGGVSKISTSEGCKDDEICKKAEEKVVKYVTCAFNLTCYDADECQGTSVTLAPKTTRNLMKEMGIEKGSSYCGNSTAFQNRVVDYIVQNFGRPIAGTFIGFAMLEFFAFVFTMCQLCSKKNKHTDPNGETFYGSLAAQKPNYGQSFVVSATPSNYWNCPRCTYENHMDFAYCAMCNTKRPENSTTAYGSALAGV